MTTRGAISNVFSTAYIQSKPKLKMGSILRKADKKKYRYVDGIEKRGFTKFYGKRKTFDCLNLNIA